MNLEYNHVVQILNEILEDPKYEGIELEEVRCKKVDVSIQVHLIHLKFPEIDSTMIIDHARDITSKLNRRLGLKDKQKFVFVNIYHPDKCAHIRLVNNGKSQNTKKPLLSELTNDNLQES